MSTVEEIAADIREHARHTGDEYVIAVGIIGSYADPNVGDLDDAARLQHIRDVLAGLDLALERKRAER